MEHWEIFVFFLIISFVYASVGFGGGSSYLAVLAMYALPFKELRLIALLCNVIVVTGGTIVYVRNKQVDINKILPLVVFSVPMAFLGARIRISDQTFFVLLGCILIVAGILLWLKPDTPATGKPIGIKQPNTVRDASLGTSIGFLSGMAGIGGGIFLSPLLNMIGWDTAKKIAATSSIFILVNSASGILGQISTMPDDINYTRILLLGLAVFIGGQIGSRLGSVKLNQRLILRITAILVFVAGIEVLSKHLP